MKNYTPCQKHELLGCYTCNRKPQLPSITKVDQAALDQWFRVYGSDPSCSFCRSTIEVNDRVTRYQGKVVHVYCLTDRGETAFHTYDNESTQHSLNDPDPIFTRSNPTMSDRYSDQKWFQDQQEARRNGTYREDE